MKKRPLVCLLALLTAVTVMHTACENDDSDAPDEILDDYYAIHSDMSSESTSTTANGLTITPSSATVEYVGQLLTFRVSGAPSSTYTWSVANANNGTITTSADSDSATYTAKAVAKNTVLVSESRHGYSATAEITTTSAKTLKIIPTTLSVDRTVAADYNFTAVGGTSPYTWYSSKPAAGTIASSGVSTATYSAKVTAAVTNTISIVDSDNNTSTATVIHE